MKTVHVRRHRVQRRVRRDILLDIDKELGLCRSWWGPLKPEYREKIKRLLADPSQDTWDEAYGIILQVPPGSGEPGYVHWVKREEIDPRERHRCPLGVTLWNAVLAVDPTFPTEGKATDLEGNTLRPWPKIPDRETVLKAIYWATGGCDVPGYVGVR